MNIAFATADAEIADLMLGYYPGCIFESQFAKEPVCVIQPGIMQEPTMQVSKLYIFRGLDQQTLTDFLDENNVPYDPAITQEIV